MSYSVASDAHKQNRGDIYNNSATGITDSIITRAFNMVKGRVSKAGLTPPASDDTLSAAEEFYIQAFLIMKGRVMGDLPSGNGSISTYDNVNKSFKMLIDLGDEQVDNYIAIANQTGAIQPSDTDGVPRNDAIGTNFKLHQNNIGTFTEV